MVRAIGLISFTDKYVLHFLSCYYNKFEHWHFRVERCVTVETIRSVAPHVNFLQ